MGSIDEHIICTNYEECVCLSCPSGPLHPEHRFSALSGAGREQTGRVWSAAGHPGLH